ncbi:hypothetical protein F4778DRAFT_769906 [Xylariomycetidae sp. FL2044]|nr:hypothetical protein F4778DRAFT_769906 [Xylariomycetidae sp. FL2044]
MVNQTQLEIIEENPIGKGLETFRASFRSFCRAKELSFDHLGHDVSRLLPSNSRANNLFHDLSTLSSAVNSDEFDLHRIRPLLDIVLADNSLDALIWDQVYQAVTELTPPPRPVVSSLQQTPWLRNTSSFANSSEHRKHVDAVLKEELGPMHAGLRGFHNTYFGGVEGLAKAAEAVLDKCTQGDTLLFNNGWIGWPSQSKEKDVLRWFETATEQLADLAQEFKPTNVLTRRLIAQPNKPLEGSTAERKLDIGFVSNSEAIRDGKCQWSRILVVGELKSNPSADKASEAWLDLGRYAREVLTAQDTRRFVLGFTICGSLMRIWEFDRLGGIASEQFDLNENGLQFVSTILGFLWMTEEQLGFDPTIVTLDSKRYIDIKRDGKPERLIIDEIMRRAPCIVGRATTCWKAHREGDSRTPLVIKDSWQFVEREEEGNFLLEATNRGVVNMARHYHHYTVQVRGAEDDVRSNVRRGLDITKAENFRQGRPLVTPGTSAASTPRAGRKRSSSHTDVALPPSKRSCSISPTKVDLNTLPNRVHRRVILRDYGEPIYSASSRAALLYALEGCIQGHESLHQAGLLHRDISINNLLINEDKENPSWPSFLIDLDLAIRKDREGVSGAKGNTGTRAFMAIGTLLGEQHSFMHDLESFFWVLFWICIHYNGPHKSRIVANFDKWNYVDMEELAKLKLGTVAKETIFMKTLTDNVTPYYEPLIALLNMLRKIVFPKDKPWDREDETLYFRMRDTLRAKGEKPN